MRRERLCAWWMVALVSVAGLGATSSRPALVDAVKQADKASVRALLQQQVDVNVSEPDGTTALHWAAHGDDPEILQLLIRAGANVNASNDYGVTPLSLACLTGNAATVDALLKAGGDPEARTSGETALMTAARTGGVDVVNVLLAHGADISATEVKSGQTMLMTAVAEAHPAVAHVLLEHGADVRARSQAGFTPLAFAVRAGNLESVKLLVAAGASANERLAVVRRAAVEGSADYMDTPDGTTVLVLAVVNAHYELATYLLDQGADPNADSDGRTALHAVVQTMNWEGLGSPDAELTGAGRLDARDLLGALLAAGANVNARLAKSDGGLNSSVRGYTVEESGTVGVTPLWIAARAGDVRTMRVLAAHGADPHLGTQQRTTPLMVAAGVGFTDGATPGSEDDALDAVEFLLELGADIHAAQGTGPDCTPRNYSGGGGGKNFPGWVCGWTSLHGAAARGADSIVKFMVDHGARLDVQDKAGKTPLKVAEFTSLNATAYIRENTARLLRELMSEQGLAER